MQTLGRRAGRTPAQADAADDPDSGGLRVGRRLVVETQWQAADVDPPAKRWLAQALRRVARQAYVTGRIGLSIVDDRAMADLHQRYSGVAGTTDVLTFDLAAQPAGRGAVTEVDGDIVLCRDVAQRQARRRGHDARLELLLYAVHGMLHLLGHDDHDPAEARRMHDREDHLLRAAGFGNVFRREGSATTP